MKSVNMYVKNEKLSNISVKCEYTSMDEIKIELGDVYSDSTYQLVKSEPDLIKQDIEPKYEFLSEEYNIPFDIKNEVENTSDLDIKSECRRVNRSRIKHSKIQKHLKETAGLRISKKNSSRHACVMSHHPYFQCHCCGKVCLSTLDYFCFHLHLYHSVGPIYQTFRKPNKKYKYNRKKSLKCEICSNQYNSKSHLLNHMRHHTGKISFKCYMLFITNISKKYINRHINVQKSYKCKICGKKYTLKGTFVKHMRDHAGENICRVCLKTFTRKCYLIRHMYIHTGEKPYKCEICSKEFRLKQTLVIHKRVHTGEKIFKCELCLKQFNQKNHLNAHWRVHTGEKRFECKICFKKMTRKHNLVGHMRFHTGEKPYKCEICGKEYSLKGTFVKHMRVHNDGKRFKCKICLKEFSINSNLKKHMVIHTGEKPFKCDICFKKFTRKNDLGRHTRIHTGEKPYKCEICGREFNLRGTLMTHLRVHSG